MLASVRDKVVVARDLTVRLAARAAPAEEAAEGPSGSPGIYVDPTPADLEALLEAVAQLPLQLYELESDSVRGRLRFGAAGTDLEALACTRAPPWYPHGGNWGG